MSYEKSPIDNFFYNIYGYLPSKAGQSYELIVNAALKLLNNESEVLYDQYIEGTYSEQKYQIDGVVNGEKTVEAKDYTLREEKVGRPDVQKQEGGLIDLPHKEGVFASATGYTRPAKLYAKGTIKNPVTKKIELFNIRPSTIDDEEGRVKTIVLEIFIKSLRLESAKYRPDIDKNVLDEFGKRHPEGQYKVAIDAIYNADGTIFTSIKDWTMSLSSEYSLDDGKKEINGTTNFNGKFIKVLDEYVPINGLTYKIEISEMREEIKIEQDGKACLFVSNEDGSINTLLTDVQLQNVVFEDGVVNTNT